MNQEHLTYFKVENFKRFDSLELTDIGQFNLIVGDNNVGKTSVLEALLFDKDRQKCLLNLHKTLFLKGLKIRPKMIYGAKGEVVEVQYPEETFLRYILKKMDESLEFNIKIADERHEGEGVSIQLSDYPKGYTDDPKDPDFYKYVNVVLIDTPPDRRYIKFISYWAYNLPEPDYYYDDGNGEYIAFVGLYEHLLSQNISQWDIPFIATSIPDNGTLPKAYFEQVDLSRKEKRQLIEDMKFLLPEIEDFEVRKIGGEDQLLLGMQGKDELMPISVFGESVTRATQILLEISKYRGKRLMIDEIDTGIHYSRMKKFLKTIFQVALKNDVQLFMTTHSLECQQAFQEVFEDVDMQEYQSKARSYSLVEKPDGQVSAQVFNFEQLQYALEIGFETRGGKRGW